MFVMLCPANRDSDNLTVFLQDPGSPGSFPTEPSATLATGHRPTSVTAADLNGDGALDLVSANEGSDNLTVFFQDPGDPGSFTEPTAIGGPGITDLARSVTAADLNGDGALDLVSANLGSDNLTVFLNR